MDNKQIIMDLLAIKLKTYTCLFSDMELLSMDYQDFIIIDNYVIVQ